MGGSSGAVKAAKIQVQGQREATAAMVAQLEKNRELQERINQENIKYLQSTEDYNRNLMGINQGLVQNEANDYSNQYTNYQQTLKDNTGQITMDNFQNSEYYDYLRGEQSRALNSSLVGRGQSLSGNAAQEFLQMGNNIAQGSFNDYFNQQMQLRTQNVNNAAAGLNASQNAVNTFIGATKYSDIGQQLAGQNNNYYQQMGSLNSAIGQTQANSINNIAKINSEVAANQQNPFMGTITGAMSGAMAGSAGGLPGIIAGGVAGGAMGYANAKNGGTTAQGQKLGDQAGGVSNDLLTSIMGLFKNNNAQSSGASLYARAS